MQALPKKAHHERDAAAQPLLHEENRNARREVLTETLKLIICTIILLGFVATIMWASDAWDTRVFIAYVAVAIVADVICVLFDD